MEASTSSAVPQQQKYDVFLSFHGKETRKNFTDHLSAALDLRGIVTFKDDESLNTGENIKHELLKAIEESRLSLVVFSKNYAGSQWCLDELVKMMEFCKTSDHIVLPIFYDVKPSEVRAQRGSVADALARHRNCGGLKLEKWKATLTEFANLSGLVLEDFSSGHEAKFIQTIVERVEKKLNVMRLSVADHPIGIESRLQRLIKMLNMESDDISIVAIWGIGEIGKTKIAKAAYNLIHRQFEGCSFVADIRETSNQPNGMVFLQKQILSDVLKSENHSIQNVHHGIELIKRRVFCRKVLLVLDDVDHARQLKDLAVHRKLLCPGSKIIITTRVVSSVDWLEAYEVYQPEELNGDESLRLFNWHAFKQEHPKEGFKELSVEVVRCLMGIPLALEVLGCLLFKKMVSVWTSAITELKKIPNPEVQKKLKISFDSLSEERKELFLDIACFFVGSNRDVTIKILEGCDFHPEIEFQELLDRGLVKCHTPSNQIMMHDLLKDMGREIVRQESIKEPGRRSRVWRRKDALEVLTNGTGTDKVEAIYLNLAKPSPVQANAKVFEKMVRLRILYLNCVHLKVGYGNITSRRLVYLCWRDFPLKLMPPNLPMEKLVSLDLCNSRLKHVWKGTKILDKLKFLNLSRCYSLVETPDFSGLRNLEELFLSDCKSLVKVHESITSLNKLRVLDMKKCEKLGNLPLGILMLKSLEYLDLSGCSNLGNVTGFKGSRSTPLPWSFFSSCMPPMRTFYRIFAGLQQATVPSLQSVTEHCSALLGRKVVIHYNFPELPENNLADSFSKGLLLMYKELYPSRSSFVIFIRGGGEVPNWFRHQSRKTNLSFVAPNKVLGWIFCATFARPIEREVFVSHYIEKNSRGHTSPLWVGHLSNRTRGQDIILLGYLALCDTGMQVKCGDKVEIWLLTDLLLNVKKWGIKLVYEDEQEEEREVVMEEDEEEEERRMQIGCLARRKL